MERKRKWRAKDLGGAGLLNLQFFDLAVKRREADIEEFRGFLSILACLIQNPKDMLLFELSKSVFQIVRKSGMIPAAQDD